VTVEGVENIRERDCIEIKTEEDYIQLVGRVKCEQEVSVLCWFLCGVVVCFQVYRIVLYIVFSDTLFVHSYHIFLVSACQSAGYTCVIRSV
jgi:hypothetical protein